MGKIDYKLLTKLISPDGRLIIYGLQNKDDVKFHNSDIIIKNLTISGFGIDNWLSKQPVDSILKLKQNLINRIEDQSFIMPVDSSWQLNNFRKAFERIESDNLDGKVLLSFNK